MCLTREQVRLFRHNGFLKLPGRLAAGSVAALTRAVRDGVRQERAPLVRDAQGRVVRLSDLWGRGPVFRDALTCPQVLDPLEALLGPNIELVTNRHNHAALHLAGDGSAYLHRDVLQWSRTIVTVLFYLEGTTVENGCTHVVPGTHLLPGLPSLAVGDEAAVREADILGQAVPVPMPAGGLLALDGTLIHTAGPNTTAGTRLSLTAGYHSVDELSAVPNPKRVLVRGTSLYLGNDRATAVSGP